MRTGVIACRRQYLMLLKFVEYMAQVISAHTNVGSGIRKVTIPIIITLKLGHVLRCAWHQLHQPNRTSG